jgi:hypothetical protein
MAFKDAEANRVYSEAQREYVRKVKSQPCSDCGQSFPYYVMDLDHVRGEKFRTVNKLAGRVGMKRLIEEVDKCDVVCANCHRIRTFTRSMPL